MTNDEQRYETIVVYNSPNLIDPSAVAATEFKRKHHLKGYVNIKQMLYLALLDIYVAIFDLPPKKDGREK